MTANELKDLVIQRANGLCEYCKSPANISSQPFFQNIFFQKVKEEKQKK